eukprot:2876617-Pyramimonas_sp.AAC.1
MAESTSAAVSASAVPAPSNSTVAETSRGSMAGRFGGGSREEARPGPAPILDCPPAESTVMGRGRTGSTDLGPGGPECAEPEDLPGKTMPW